MTEMLVLLMAAGVAGASPPWKAFAACSAAYEVNAQLADPDRPASMKAMVSDVAVDYRNAAEALYRRAAHASKGAARRAVASEVERRAAELRPMPRTDVEKLIDACPQLPEPS